MVPNNPQPGALEGLRVIDLTQVMAGPFCSMLLGDLGAEVIKVEPPEGEYTRHERAIAPGVSASFLAVNRNKKGLVLDLKQPEGVAILRKLAATADVLVENYRPGVAKRLGIDFQTLREINPRLVYCSISGFGQTGPYASRGGFDLIAQGMSGIMSATGSEGGPPVKVGVPITDLGAGLFAVFGILCALRARRVTGRGQLVDTSLFEAGVQQTHWQSAIYFATGQPPGPSGSAHILSAPYQAFRAADGWLTIGGANQANWERVTRVLGAPEWAMDARFRTNADRMNNLPDLVALMSERLKTRPAREWLAALEAEGVPCGPINSIADMAADPQTAAREMVIEFEHRRAGRTRALGLPIKLSASPGRVMRPAPLLGEHTREVLTEFGFSASEVEALLASGGAVSA